MVERGLDGVALAGHVEFGEEGEGLLELLLFGCVVALRARQQTPVPVAIAEVSLETESQRRWLRSFLEQS